MKNICSENRIKNIFLNNEIGNGYSILFALSLLITSIIIFTVTVGLANTNNDGKETPIKWIIPVTEDTTDPAQWGATFPNEYESYKRTVDSTRTRFGGSEAMPESKLERDPWLKRMYAGYAFSIDYRDRRGHAYMLQDQETSKRITEKKQPGACLHCHSSIIPAYRYIGKSDVMKGFELVCSMPYQEALNLKDDKGNKLVQHPVSCVDCHSPDTMELRITRPGFINGIKALKTNQGVNDYDPNRDASQAEMRIYVCAQCHVEYYFKGDGKLLTYPWNNGLKIEDIEKYYDDMLYSDWIHAETGAGVLKAQHPEFELWSQGYHAEYGVACADCHMPTVKEGAKEYADHWVRSPVLNINCACLPCHSSSEEEMKKKVDDIQEKTHKMVQQAAKALTDMLDAIVEAKNAGATDAQLKPIYALQRKAQWRLDFISSENSMGFHAPQEAARILAESIDYSRQAELVARKLISVK